MGSRLLLALLLLDLILLVTIVRYARAGRLALRYALAALTAALVFTVLIAIPPLLSFAATITGVQSWLAALLGAFVLATIWLFLRLGLELSKLSDQTIRLAQELAILRAELGEPGQVCRDTGTSPRCDPSPSSTAGQSDPRRAKD